MTIISSGHVDAATSNAMVVLASASQSLSASNNVTDAAEIHRKLAAIQTYAREAHDTNLLEKATRALIESERRAGQLLISMRASNERQGRGGNRKSKFQAGTLISPNVPTLAELGLTKKQSMKWQRLACMAESAPQQFDAYVERAVSRVVAVVDPDSVTDSMRAAVEAHNRTLDAIVPDIPEGRYTCIVIDPPWPMQKIEREVRPRQVGLDYPVMSEAALASFDVPSLAADDCHLFCWATQKHLPSAFRLVDHWGFHYVLLMVWHKAGGFQPVGLPQYNCEFVVYARQGHPLFLDTAAFPVCFEAPRREHSRKPEFFYELVSRVTAGPRIDVFSREIHAGFAQYGNEPTRFNDELPR
ncbi:MULTISPECIES: MT-A70 family methyltransferase [Burkholderia cepacia complex]|uniref:MT-A70 family methyltransferase n=1 Tax=Burkholderia cepacia complex TaxID=87882 RepID=UPI00076D3EF6|nr:MULTISPECIES: MT-A70 family methyltransferase [Burkholderia cepacia complex]KWO46372.1 hypothetical protein WT98_21955 [Burkholderia territorii]